MTGLCKLGSRRMCALLIVLSGAAHNTVAQIPTEYIAQFPAPTPRIANPVNDDALITLRGNRHPKANSANDRGEVAADQPLHRMLLLLRRSPEQEAALASLLTAQQDPGSPLFHKWLTPEEFGALFGPADQDVETITNWLGSKGFTGVAINKGRTVIEFSGDAVRVKRAFHTSVHQYLVAGTTHFANQADPSLPVALAPVVTGVVSLNNFGYKSEIVVGPTLEYSKGQARPKIVPDANPLFTVPQEDGGALYNVAPYDFAAIYDLQPLWTAGFDGSGQTIAIVGETDINLNDPEQFRAFLDLPVNNPIVTVVGDDPGVQQDEIESDLDVEWSGAVAKGAQIQLVSSASTETTPGVDLSALYIVDNNLAPVMSESYGDCELFLGTAGNAFHSALSEQAAAEGITFLVSSGDQGSSACDPTDADQYVAFHPMAVNGLASTPYNLAVGGTDFNQYKLWSQYWSTTNDPTTKQSVLGYIPEIPWNDTCGSTTLDAIYDEDPSDACANGFIVNLYEDTIAAGGGPSTCINSNGSDASTCTAGWPKPAWQVGTGVPADGVRDIPDVSLFASNDVYNSAYIVCDIDASGGSGCDPTGSQLSYVGVGGTSASVQAMAGVMAIIDQKYGRQGNAGPTLYRLAASSLGPSIFHDITTDGNRVPCLPPDSDCLLPPANSDQPFGRTAGHDSTVGYDLATGLGSIDIANLVNNWATITLTPTKTSLTLNGGTATVTAVHGTPIDAVASVSASSGSPSGNVSLIGAVTNSSSLLGTLIGGAVAGNVDTLPGGSYSIVAHYGGDSQFAPSASSPISVVISPEPSTTKVSIPYYNPSTEVYSAAPASVIYGSFLIVRSDTTGQSGNGIASGSVAFTDAGAPLGQFSLNAQGTAEYIPTNLFLAGVHSFKAVYGGDSSFKADSGTGNVTVTPAPMTCALAPNTTVLRQGWSLTLNPTAELYQSNSGPPLGNMVPPTGTMTIYSGSTAVAGPETVTGSAGGIDSSTGTEIIYSLPTASVPTVTLQISQLASIIAPVTVAYSGDANYSACTSPPLQLTYETNPVASEVSGGLNPQQNIPPGTPVILSIEVGSAVVPPADEPPYPAPTGTVQLSVDGSNIGSPVGLTSAVSFNGGNVGAANLSIPTGNLSNGMHSATVTYGGDSNYLATGGPFWDFWIVSPDFSMQASPASLTVTNGATTGPSTISVTALNSFSGVVTFSCSGLPSGAACVFTPATVQGSGSTALTITTTKAQDVRVPVLAQNTLPRKPWLIGFGGISFAFVAVLLVPRCRRKSTALFILATVAFAFGVASCGGRSGGGTGGGGSGGGGGGGGVIYATSTSVTAATATPSKGENDTFTAAVTGGGVVTGSIQFGVDGAASGSPVSLSNGTAQFATSFTIGGNHSVTAAYSGDATHKGSSGAAVVTIPYTTGSVPGTYMITITATCGALTHTTPMTLTVN